MGQLKKVKISHQPPQQAPEQEVSPSNQKWLELDNLKENCIPCWDLDDDGLRIRPGNCDRSPGNPVYHLTILSPENTFFSTNVQGEVARTHPVPEIVLCAIIVSIRKCAQHNGSSPKTNFLYPDLQYIRWQDLSEYDRLRTITDHFIQEQGPSGKREYLSTSRARLLEKTQRGFEEVDSCIVETKMQWNRFLPPMIARLCGTERMTPFLLELHADYEWFAFGGVSASNDSDIWFKTIHSTLATTALKNFEGEDYWSKKLLKRLFDGSTVQKLVEEYVKTKQQLTDTTQQVILVEQIDCDLFVEWLLSDRIRLLAAIIWINADLDCLYSLMQKHKGAPRMDIKDSQIPLKEDVYSTFLSPSYRALFRHVQAGLGPVDFPEPMKAMEVQDDDLIPINYNKQKPLGEGGTSDVFRATIHSDYHAFSSNKNEVFALKVPKRFALEDAQKEVKNWQRFARVPHPHINTLHTCWIQKEKFYMLSPLAEHNLDYFLHNAESPDLIRDAEWILEQLEGIASAIQHIHHVGRAGWDSSRTSNDKIDNGYHHDLKPANILLFALKYWKITDFGTARVRQFMSSSPETGNFYTHDLPGGDEEYGGPDRNTAGNGPRRVGSAYDIWSFGCILLEVLLWSFGKTGDDLEKFRCDRAKDKFDTCECQLKERSDTHRRRKSVSDSDSDDKPAAIKIPNFWFQCEKANKFHVKPSVQCNLAWVKDQIIRHHPILIPLHRLVKRMLNVHAKDRPAASVIQSQLGILRVQASAYFAKQRYKRGDDDTRVDENIDFDLQTNLDSFAKSSRMGTPPLTDEETMDQPPSSQPSQENKLKRRRASSIGSYSGTTPLQLGANVLSHVGDALKSQADVREDPSDLEISGEKEGQGGNQRSESHIEFKMEVQDIDKSVNLSTSPSEPKIDLQKQRENSHLSLDWKTATRPTQPTRTRQPQLDRSDSRPWVEKQISSATEPR